MQFLIKALVNIIESDFKTVKKKFLDQGINLQDVDKYLKTFKDLRDKQKIKKEDEKNIDFWGKKNFDEFKTFVDNIQISKNLPKRKTKTEIPGAKLIAENEDWFLYKVLEKSACEELGEDTEWCIRMPDSNWWTRYARRMQFYFYISKKRSKKDRFFKIAMGVSANGTKRYWDASDVKHTTLPSDLNLPKARIVKFQPKDDKNINAIAIELSDAIERMLYFLLHTPEHNPFVKVHFQQHNIFVYEKIEHLIHSMDNGQDIWDELELDNGPYNLFEYCYYQPFNKKTNIFKLNYVIASETFDKKDRFGLHEDDLIEEYLMLTPTQRKQVDSSVTIPEYKGIEKKEDIYCVNLDLSNYGWAVCIDEEKLQKRLSSGGD